MSIARIFNLARTHDDGKYRAHHQYPVYGWKKAAGAMFRANLAWDLRNRLGVRMEQYGPNAEFTRIDRHAGGSAGLLVEAAQGDRGARAGELGIPTLGNAARLAGVNKLTRAGKSHDNDPEVRHRRWRDEAASFAEREELVAAVTGNKVEVSARGDPRTHRPARRSAGLSGAARKRCSAARTWWKRRPTLPRA